MLGNALTISLYCQSLHRVFMCSSRVQSTDAEFQVCGYGEEGEETCPAETAIAPGEPGSSLPAPWSGESNPFNLPTAQHHLPCSWLWMKIINSLRSHRRSES